MLKLTDSELDVVMCAARPLAVQDRDGFLQAVAERLSSLPHLGDGLVFQIARASSGNAKPAIIPEVTLTASSQSVTTS
jgi:hypothetical protein